MIQRIPSALKVEKPWGNFEQYTHNLPCTVPVRNELVALGAGVMLGVALAFLPEYLYLNQHSPDEEEQPSVTTPKEGTPKDMVASGKNEK